MPHDAPPRHRTRQPAGPERLALDLYAAVLDGQGLDQALGAITMALGGTRGLVQRVSLAGAHPEAHAALANFNFDPDLLGEYASYWVAHDPFLLASRGLGPGVVNLSRLVTPEALRQTAYWSEFLIRRAPIMHGLSLLTDEPQAMTGVFTIWRDAVAEPFGAAEERLLRQLQPHIIRALTEENRLAGATLQAAALNALRPGIAVIAPSGVLLFANDALRGMARQADGLAIGPRGLALPAREQQTALDRVIAMGLLAAMGAGKLLDEGVSTVSLLRPSGTVPWIVEVMPLRPGGVALLVTDPAARRAPSEALLMLRLRLTASEASLAACLASGGSVADHAAARGISIATARTQLSRALRRTGSTRQVELILRINKALG